MIAFCLKKVLFPPMFGLFGQRERDGTLEYWSLECDVVPLSPQMSMFFAYPVSSQMSSSCPTEQVFSTKRWPSFCNDNSTTGWRPEITVDLRLNTNLQCQPKQTHTHTTTTESIQEDLAEGVDQRLVLPVIEHWPCIVAFKHHLGES
jgi:hypothetical protein